MNDDGQLVRQYATEGNEAAFAEVVARHVDLVYSTALRITNGEASLAEDVTQEVFVDLARKARRLSKEVVLAGWLYEAARFAAAKAVRKECRRQAREQEAMAMQDSTPETSPGWDRLRPVLDAALGELSAADRNAVLLRFFNAQDFRTVGLALGISEDAAQKRVARALEKLRWLLIRRGVTLTVSVTASLMSANAVQAAPPGLALAVTTTSLAGAATAPAGFLASLVHPMTIAKTTLLGTAAVFAFLLGLGVVGWWHFKPLSHGRFVTIDLTPHYNGELTVCWLPGFDPGSHLADLPRGRQVFAQIPFDVRGVVQLNGLAWRTNGYRFPERVEGIAIGNRCRRIHLLHANSAFKDPPDTTVANLFLHYTDGTREQIEILQGEHVVDWWAWWDTPPADPNSVIAWTGQNPASKRHGIKTRLIKTTFDNPQPAKQLQTIDYASAMAGSAPFMVGLTVEP